MRAPAFRSSPSLRVAVFMASVCAVSACPQTGTYDGGAEDDAGPGDDVIPAELIGTACRYDPDVGGNPTNTCASGLECLIVTRDGAFDSGLALDAWEDQFTVYNSDGTDSGYCTLTGTEDRPPACPVGTAFKRLTPGIQVCVRPCAAPAQCGRSDYTCDVRFLDVVDGAGTPIPTCVRSCALDVPDCIRTGVFPVTGGLLPVISYSDMTGSSRCVEEQGTCTFVEAHGNAGPGEPCSSTEQCAQPGVCLQGPLLAVLSGGKTGPDDSGFCGSPCAYNAADPAQGCSNGYVCQPGFTLGYGDGPIYADDTGGLIQGGGFCFHQCSEVVPGNCDPIVGTTCGSADEAVLGAESNGVAMCLPDAVRLGG